MKRKIGIISFFGILLNSFNTFANSIATKSIINTNDLITKKIVSFGNFIISFVKGNNILISVLGVVVIIIIINVLINKIFKKDKAPKTTIITESTIQHILNISELSTIEYPFESIAIVYKEDKKDGEA